MGHIGPKNVKLQRWGSGSEVNPTRVSDGLAPCAIYFAFFWDIHQSIRTNRIVTHTHLAEPVDGSACSHSFQSTVSRGLRLHRPLSGQESAPQGIGAHPCSHPSSQTTPDIALKVRIEVGSLSQLAERNDFKIWMKHMKLRIFKLQCPASGSAKRSGDSPQISQACALNTRSPSSYALLTQQAGTKCLLRHTRCLIYSKAQYALFSCTRSFFIKTDIYHHISITMPMCHA